MNTELLKELDTLIETSSDKELDTEKIMENLRLLQEYDPVAPLQSQQEAWEDLMRKAGNTLNERKEELVYKTEENRGSAGARKKKKL